MFVLKTLFSEKISQLIKYYYRTEFPKPENVMQYHFCYNY